MPSGTESLALYRSMLRQAAKFNAYNFRNYAFRKVRDEFVRNRFETNPEKIQELVSDGRRSLAMLTRQGAISQMYATPELVVEK